jgi:hypothetical protein
LIRYDPDQTPDPAAWLELDEGERILLVEQYHREARVPLANNARTLHAVLHVIVENQLALEDQAIVRETLDRLRREGLTRHEAVRAIASALAGHVHDLLHEKSRPPQDDTRYHDGLRQLNAEQWQCES